MALMRHKDPTELALAAHARLMLRELRGRQLDVTPALAALRRGHGDPARRATMSVEERFAGFWRTCEQLAADPSFGLRAGQRVQLEDLELLGLLMRASSDGRSMLTVLQRYGASWLGGITLQQEGASDGAGLRVCPLTLPSGAPLPRVLADCALARALSIVRLLLGPWVKPARVELAHERPHDPSVHAQLFASALKFGAEANVLVFSAEVLSARSPHRDPVLQRVLERHLDKSWLLPRAPVDIVEKVREVVCTQLPTGNTSLAHVATILQRSERTLRRQLRHAGTSYQGLLDEQRSQIALSQLREYPRRSAVQLSDALGFSNPAAFYRAFKRWTGARWSTYQGDKQRPAPEARATMHAAIARPRSPASGAVGGADARPRP